MAAWRFSFALLVIGAAVGCREPIARPALADLDVILIVIDTFGAEHAGRFQNPGATHTPNMDRLAADGVVFRNAYAPAPWTLPSMGSIFTGTMPSRHEITWFGHKLSPQVTTLAEHLQRRGFDTAGIVSNWSISHKNHLNRGFDAYAIVPPFGGPSAVSSKFVTDAGIQAVRRNAATDKNLFLYVHYFDPHFMYLPHPEFDRTSGYTGDLRPLMGVWALRRRRHEFSDADTRYLLGLHHEEIAHTDAHIGRLLDYLDARANARPTLIILTSDHGEEFMRHGWIGHTRTLYGELLHVPLIIALPGIIPPGVVDDPVSLLDILPTVLALGNQPATPISDLGMSLVPYLVRTGRPAAGRPLFGEVAFDPLKPRDKEMEAHKTSLLSGHWKLIHDLPTDTWEFYDLRTDPEELQNLAGGENPEYARMRTTLEAWERDRTAEARDATATDLEPDEIERLRALGYIQ